ncbi:MAG: bifunctional diaminohydroxyphosphoribosylaminopyrimidine deaminase/5-amino-6-(5-phosphoribosylamino)uracil reductase RibD [Desulfovermiculus sp.]|nr:bifunctional diaminohydroxyphosphoribosylaminopyrimidine deaminase/5-amino-6-(5-phosphoribosylamino)uracil reductase RibD [Desulfovermiculus sp.]
MLHAVRLALQAKGQTAPNPCVGAVLTKGGIIAAVGWHKGPGLPHAEIEALSQAKEKGWDLTDLTLWVTLEPCNHFGRTPPCTQAILDVGISRVIIGTLDPNPKVTGGGAERLRGHGVHVVVGQEEQACLDLISDFRAWTLEYRPFVQLKLAATLDGRIATRTGHSAWVTGEAARQRVHNMRSRTQAVLIGGRTLNADNPRLTNRSAQGGRQPWAVVVTGQLPRPDADMFLLQNRPRELVFLTSQEQAASEHAQALERIGVTVWGLPHLKRGGRDLRSGLQRLYQDLGCAELLCEGGGRLGMGLVQSGLVDELHLVLAPKVVGDESGVSMLSGRQVMSMDEAVNWRLISHEQVGEDLWLVYRPHAAANELGTSSSNTNIH